MDGFNFVMSADNKPYLHKRIDQLDASATRWTVTVKPFKAKRTLDQNSRLWKLYTALGEHIGHSPDEVHQLMGWKFLRELKTINGETVEVIKSTTKLTTSEMSTYQDGIERWASQIGFYFIED